jgi:hypothetical protein
MFFVLLGEQRASALAEEEHIAQLQALFFSYFLNYPGLL